jgi:hypothetical protein
MTTTCLTIAMIAMLAGAASPPSEETSADPHRWHAAGTAIAGGHVLPHFAVVAEGTGSRSEAGIGALIPWADRLWAIGYVAHIRGAGLGLYEIRSDLSWRLHPASVTGTFANRFVHWPTEQVFIGPHAIDAKGNVRTIEALKGHRLTATTNHLSNANQLYFLSMEGLLWEVDARTLESRELFDLTKELDWADGAYKHFKAAHVAQGRLVVANNTYEEPEHLGTRTAGRLAEWDGKGAWRILERNPFIEVAGKQNQGAGAYYGNTLFAVGWDRASVILRVLHGGEWRRYRLPFGSASWSHTWNTEWMRIREVQTERYLMDAFGLFYDLPALVHGGHLQPVRPIATHLRICPDFVHWRGALVLAGDQTDNAVGQPQSGLWFGSIDDLAGWGKPTGWGAMWRHEEVKGGATSDPFLMTGFDRKSLHLLREDDRTGPVDVIVEIDFLGDGTWVRYQALSLHGAGAYAHHEFPDAFSAHWVRVRATGDAKLTAQLFYR